LLRKAVQVIIETKLMVLPVPHGGGGKSKDLPIGRCFGVVPGLAE
jgi:hypothetical protein